MTSAFHFIKPGEQNDHIQLAEALNAGRFGTEGAIFDAVALADSAGLFFRGSFPMEAPHFAWGALLNLPWHSEYWTVSTDGQSFRPNPIGEEVLRIAEELKNVAASPDDHNPWQQLTYHSELLSKSNKLLMQGLATEVLLSVDGFLCHLSGGFLSEALPWFAAAYKNIIECTCHAQQILGYASENARTAALSRHRENHQMKAQVWDWYAQHKDEYPSMDKAAEAVVGPVKLVPVSFRTARAWIGEWVKNLRSARRP